MAKKQKNDPYAICTAQKKKSGMGHDEWKRCVDKVKTQKESKMDFYKRLKEEWSDASRDAAAKKRKSGSGPSQADKDWAKKELGATYTGRDSSDTKGDPMQGAEDARKERERKRARKKAASSLGMAGSNQSEAITNLVKKFKLSEKRKRKKNEAAAEFAQDAEYTKGSEFSTDDEEPKNEVTSGKMTNTLPDGPKQAGRTPSNKEEDDLDAEDTMGEMAVNAEKKDKDWIQKAVNPDHEGYCTPMTKSTCTPKRKALAKTFKKMGKKRDREIKAKDEK